MLCLCLCLVALLCVFPHTLKAHSIHSLCTLYRGLLRGSESPISSRTRACQPMGRLICCSLAARMTFHRLCGALSAKLLCLAGGCPTFQALSPCFRDWPRGAAKASPPLLRHGESHIPTNTDKITHNPPPPLWHTLILGPVCPEVWLKVFYKLSLLLLG